MRPKTQAFLNRLEEHGCKVKQAPNGRWDVTCPVHKGGQEERPSLSVSEAPDKILLKCHRNCTHAQICEAIGWKVADLFENSRNGKHPQGEPWTVYPYTDESGKLLSQVLKRRLEGDKKKIVQRRPDPGAKDGWAWNLEGVRRVPYRVTDLLKTKPGDTIFIPEGEPDADSLWTLGLPATTNAMGAGEWRAEHTAWLKQHAPEHRFIILRDEDPPGHRHAEEVLRQLLDAGLDARPLVLPGLEFRPDHGPDVTDWLKKGGTKAELLALALAAETPTNYEKNEISPSRSLGSYEKNEERGLNSFNSYDSSHGSAESTGPALAKEALHGVTGDLINALAPETEAAVASLVFQFLTGVGNLIGPAAYAAVGPTRHPAKLSTLIVGQTGTRKGTGWDLVLEVLRQIDSLWHKGCVQKGLSTGEGLIYHVRDSRTEERPEKEDGKPTGDTVEVVVDPGVTDKRRIVVETEFSTVLQTMTRQGNVLTGTIRQAWDGDTLQTMTRSAPLRATGTHISMIGHITPADVARYMQETDMWNGFANRMLWVNAERARLLPSGGQMPNVSTFVQTLHERVVEARKGGLIRRTPEAEVVWAAVYPALSTRPPGLYGALTGRAEAQVLRLSLLWALLDGLREIRVSHLLAALACWEFAEATVRFLFGDRTGDGRMDKILFALRAAEVGLTRTQISDLFGRNEKSTTIEFALERLAAGGLASKETGQTGGRDEERWFAMPVTTSTGGRYLQIARKAAGIAETTGDEEEGT